MAVSGIGLAAVAAGGLLVYSGAKGYSIPTALADMIRGKPPSGGQTPPQLNLAGSTGSSGGGSGSSGGGSGVGAQVPANLRKLLLGGHTKRQHNPGLVFPLICPPGFVPNASGSACVPAGVGPLRG